MTNLSHKDYNVVIEHLLGSILDCLQGLLEKSCNTTDNDTDLRFGKAILKLLATLLISNTAKYLLSSVRNRDVTFNIPKLY